MLQILVYLIYYMKSINESLLVIVLLYLQFFKNVAISLIIIAKIVIHCNFPTIYEKEGMNPSIAVFEYSRETLFYYRN